MARNAKDMDFKDVLRLFEINGWALLKVWKPYRVFSKEGRLLWLIPVHDGKVDYEYVKKIINYFKGCKP